MNTINISHTLINLLINYIELNDLHLPPKLSNTLMTTRQGDALSYPLWCDLLAQVSQWINKPELGIELGELAEAEHGGILAYLVSSCDTLRDAMEHFQRFQTLLYGGEGEVVELGDHIRVSWSNDIQPSLGTQLSDEVLIIGLVHFIKRLTGKTLELAGINFIHNRPSYEKLYQKHLTGEIRFANGELSVEFPKHYLDLAILNPEPVLKDILAKQAATLLLQAKQQEDNNLLLDKQEKEDEDFSRKLNIELLACINESHFTLDALSAKMNMSSRTLHRRLDKQGKNFNQLLKQARLEMAIDYLERSSLSLSEISYRLGYTEQSAFSRAFKQWTGKTPKQYLAKSN